MRAEKQHFVLYVCFKTDQEDEIFRSLAVISDQAEVENWKKEKRDSVSADGKSDPDAEEFVSTVSEEESEKYSEDPSIEFTKLMGRFHETMSSYRPLVEIGMIIMPTLRSQFIYNEMYKNADKQLVFVEKDQQFKTYGVTVDQFPSVMTQVRRLRGFDRGVMVLPGAILLSLVATFDSFFADTLRLMLRRKPERVIDSSKTIGVREVLNMSSFDDLVQQIVEDEVEAIMRGSHDEQVKFVENRLEVGIRSHYDEWGAFMEVFERRNLIAHGNHKTNSHYIKNCNIHGLQVGENQIGERLSLDEGYLRRSSERLLELGLSLMFVLWLKHFNNSSEKAYESLNGRAYELIKDGQSRVAARLLDLALFKQKATASDKVKKMMTVNLANSYRKLNNEEKAREVI